MDDIDIVGRSHRCYGNNGSIDIDPVFTSYNGTDYFLAANSSCIHAGTEDIDGFTFPEYDLMGNPRLHGNVDMGAYENPFVPVSTNDLPALSAKVRAYPNPSGGMVTLTVTLEESDNGVLEIFNNKGERIEQLCNGTLTKGSYPFYLNKAGELPAGVEFRIPLKPVKELKTEKL
ncbi:MAG: choice-of-anchor Q domain-containing protein [Bacteroidales bacterium]|nr:choice-of-anchor Q domain-containing protein [Bacteroidales bacterium]